MSTGFSRSKDFVCESGQGFRKDGLPISDLIDLQETENVSTEETWVSSLGADLHVYLTHSWSSFESLKALQNFIGEKSRDAGNPQRDIKILEKVSGLYNNCDLVAWQQAWGGLFVSSLRILAERSMCFALLILHKSMGSFDSVRRSALAAEICEALGTAYYTGLVGSQLYGYPLQVMTNHLKRKTAEMALACFTRALREDEVDDCPDIKDGSDTDERMTWDLHFMIGKVSLSFLPSKNCFLTSHQRRR